MNVGTRSVRVEEIKMAKTTSSKITAERVRYLFNYDPVTGVFSRRVGYGRVYEGAIIQSLTLFVDGEWHKTVRYIWLHYYGEWPPEDMLVDHKDRKTGLHNIDNLRLATHTQNQQNKSGSGQYAKGVTWRDRIMNPWQAKIRVNGNRIHLGSFATEEEAAQAYQEACIEYHGKHGCTT